MNIKKAKRLVILAHVAVVLLCIAVLSNVIQGRYLWVVIQGFMLMIMVKQLSEIKKVARSEQSGTKNNP